MADTREILLKLLGKETVSDAARKAARGLDDMGDAADDAARDTAKLDRAIADTEKSIARLKDQARRSDDPLSFMRDINKQKRSLKSLTSLMHEVGEDGATGLTAGFTARIGPAMMGAKTAISGALLPVLGTVAAAAAPMIAATLTAGIVGAIGAGAAGAGVALAIADDPKIQAAGKRLGLTIRTSLTDAAQPFRSETLAAIGDVRQEFVALQPTIQRVFEDSAKFVRPLTAGLTGAIQELGPGLEAAVGKAGPVIDVIARKLPELGRTFSNQIEMIAGGSEEAAEALSTMFTAIQMGVSTVGPTIRTLTELFGLLDKAGLATGFIGIAEDIGLFNTNAKKMTGMNGEVIGALDKTGEAASGAAVEVKTLAERMRELADTNRSAVDSEIAFEEAIDGATAAAKENGKTTDTNTAKGRANMRALSDLAAATLTSADATRDATSSQEKVNGVMQRGYDKFVAAAKAMGMSKAKADELARSLGLIPPSKTITIRYPTMTAAEIKARALARAINTIDTYKEILIVQRLAVKGQRVSGVTGVGGHTEFAEGGPVRGGVPNRDSVRALLTPGEYVLNKRMVAAMGGMDVLERVRRGGGSVASQVTASWAGGSGPSADLGQALMKLLRYEVRVQGGGNVQSALGT